MLGQNYKFGAEDPDLESTLGLVGRVNKPIDRANFEIDNKTPIPSPSATKK